MQKIQLVLTDLDGTAVYPEAHEISEEVMTVIQEGQEKGVTFCAVTGRPYWMAKDLLSVMGFKDPCIFDGGASIADPVTGEILWSKYLPATTTRAAVEQLLPYAFEIEYDKGTLTTDMVDLDAITNPVLSVWASVSATEGERIVEELRTLPETAVHGNPHPGGDTSKWGIQVTHFLRALR
jgi:hydroxymethylpyrimidine pyrophosphatase-like HAD family hydrolase